MVRTALSLTVLLVRFSLDSDMTSVRVDQDVCMECQSGQAGHGATYFPTYKAAACHCHGARSRACNQSNRCIRLVTIQSRLLAVLVPQGLGHQPVPTRQAQNVGYIPIRLCTSFATYHLISEIYYLFRLWKVVCSQKTAYITTITAS